MDDPHAGRHDAEALERALRPAQQRVALAVALVLALDVAGVRERACRRRRPGREWSITRSAGTSGSTPAGSRPARAIGGAHRGEVDDRGHAGEVLQDHARGQERAPTRCPAPAPASCASARTSSSVTWIDPALRSAISSRTRTRVRQARGVGDARLVQPRDAEEVDAGMARQGGACAEGIAHAAHHATGRRPGRTAVSRRVSDRQVPMGASCDTRAPWNRSCADRGRSERSSRSARRVCARCRGCGWSQLRPGGVEDEALQRLPDRWLLRRRLHASAPASRARNGRSDPALAPAGGARPVAERRSKAQHATRRSAEGACAGCEPRLRSAPVGCREQSASAEADRRTSRWQVMTGGPLISGRSTVL